MSMFVNDNASVNMGEVNTAGFSYYTNNVIY